MQGAGAPAEARAITQLRCETKDRKTQTGLKSMKREHGDHGDLCGRMYVCVCVCVCVCVPCE